MSTMIQQLLLERPDVKEKYYSSVAYPRYECPECGNPIHEATYKDINKDIVCNICDKATLKQFAFIERR